MNLSGRINDYRNYREYFYMKIFKKTKGEWSNKGDA